MSPRRGRKRDRRSRAGYGRAREARARVGVVTALFLAVALAGATTALATGYLVVRGPFLDGPALEPMPLFAALGGFLVGIVVTTWAAVRAADVGSRF